MKLWVNNIDLVHNMLSISLYKGWTDGVSIGVLPLSIPELIILWCIIFWMSEILRLLMES